MIRFKDFQNGRNVYLNPAHIIAVVQLADEPTGVRIYTTGTTNDSGASLRFNVEGNADNVAAQLKNP